METRKRAKPATPEKYLWRKPGARHLWFRVAVPLRYQPIEGRKIVQRCLGTNERQEASLLAARLRADLFTRWKLEAHAITTRAAAKPSDVDLKAAAANAAYLEIQPKVEALWRQKRQQGEAPSQYVAALTRVRQRYLETRETSTLSKWERLADKSIALGGWNLPKGTVEYNAFAQMMAEAAIELLRVEAERRSGRFGATPTSPVVVDGLSTSQEQAPAGEGITELFERYAAQRVAEKRKRPDTVRQDRRVIEQFVSFVGRTKSVRAITQKNVREWRDLIAELPPKFASSKQYRGLSLPDAAEAARKKGAPRVSPTTVNKYLSTISPFLGWCVRNGFAERNSCDDLFYDLRKGTNPRPPFSSEQLKLILSSPLFTGFEKDGHEHVTGSQRANDWRFWIPLVCLFTGARIGEIAQLRTDDLQSEDAIPFISIRHDESREQTTKSGQTRVMPLHPKLVKLGFVAFVEQQKVRSSGEGSPWLFPELVANERGSRGAGPSRFWRNYLHRIAVKAKADGYGSHSFRHALADKLRLAGYIDEEIKVVLGHSQKSVTSSYGRVRQGTVQRIMKMIEGLEFKEVDELVKIYR